jgi:hypothetical protein
MSYYAVLSCVFGLQYKKLDVNPSLNFFFVMAASFPHFMVLNYEGLKYKKETGLHLVHFLKISAYVLDCGSMHFRA